MRDGNMMSFSETGAGFPVLMGHSYLFDRTMWQPQITALSERYRLIMPDLWGHGDSPALPSSVMTIQDIATGNLEIMDSLGIKEFAVVGLSVGGMWGAELAALAPDRVKALMLFDTFSGSEIPEQRKKYDAMLNTVNTEGAVYSPLLEYIISQFYSHEARDEDIQALQAHLFSLDAHTLQESIVPIGRIIFDRNDRMSILEKIICPVHVATGEYDLPRPPSEGKQMAVKLGCGFTMIPEAGHISNREQPGYVTRLICRFLDRVTQG